MDVFTQVPFEVLELTPEFREPGVGPVWGSVVTCQTPQPSKRRASRGVLGLHAADRCAGGLFTALEESCRKSGLEAEQLPREVRLRDGGTIIGSSPEIVALREEIADSAASRLTVLITGETGVGKELVARAVHQHSTRNQRSLV